MSRVSKDIQGLQTQIVAAGGKLAKKFDTSRQRVASETSSTANLAETWPTLAFETCYGLRFLGLSQ